MSVLQPAPEVRPAAVGLRQTTGARLRGLFSRPLEGWSTLAALLVMMVVVGVAVDDSGWAGAVTGTRSSQTSFLPLYAVLATLIGFVLGRSRLGTFRSHLLGATIGALLLLVAAAGAVSGAADLGIRLQALVNSVATFIGDVSGRGVRSAETSIFVLLVGALLWSAAQLGAFSLFRRHRPTPAIGLAAATLLVNMSITVEEQLPHLVVLMAAALLLIVRTSLVAQLEQWRVRRIADTAYASQLFVRSGAAFVGTAIALSLVLAVNASSAPLRPMWDQALDRLIEVGLQFNHLIGGVSGPARGPNLLFTPSQTIRDQWETSNEPVFSAFTADGRGYKWRGATYDYFDGRQWQHVAAARTPVPAHQDLLGYTSDRGLTEARHEVLAEITSIALNGNTIVAPADPVSVDHPITVETNAEGGLLRVRLTQDMVPGSSYVVTSRVFPPVGSGALTVSGLASAGVQYGEAYEPYVDIQTGAIGPVTQLIADNIVGSLSQQDRDPYHIAFAFQKFLYKDGAFEYQTDVRGMCTGENLVDCFLRERKGYCEYFATAMVMMLRTQHIPARYVVGYLPGKIEQVVTDEGETVSQRVVTRAASHAWVEVYFPGYGWVPFDPTPGLTDAGQEPTELPEGSPLPTLRPDATPQVPNFGPTPDDGGLIPPPTNPTPPAAGPPPVLALAFGVAILGVALVLIVLARRRRLPGSGQLTYDSVARMAARFGYGPLPSQTAYEYADRLAIVVPTVRNELHVVATAKVEALYGRREPTDELRVRLLMAYRKVRRSLLALLLRRPSWLNVPGRRS